MQSSNPRRSRALIRRKSDGEKVWTVWSEHLTDAENTYCYWGTGNGECDCNRGNWFQEGQGLSPDQRIKISCNSGDNDRAYEVLHVETDDGRVLVGAQWIPVGDLIARLELLANAAGDARNFFVAGGFKRADGSWANAVLDSLNRALP